MTKPVSSIINRAGRLLKVIDAASATPALFSENALIALNAMCLRWEQNGLAIGWAVVDQVDDDLPCQDYAEEAIAYNLAVALGPEFPEPSTWGEIKQRAGDSLAELRRDRMVAAPLKQVSDLPAPEANCGQWNIYTDSPA